MGQEKDRYWKRFAIFTAEGKIDTISRALKITPEMSEQVIQKIEKELFEQKMLFNLAKQKQELSKNEAERMQKIKLLSVRKIKKIRKEGRVHRLIRTQFYGEIEKLRKENISWRIISMYILQNYHKKIPHQSLKRVFELLQQDFSEKQ